MAQTRKIELKNGITVQVTCTEMEKPNFKTGEYDIVTRYVATYKNEKCDSYDIDSVLEYVRKTLVRIDREKNREERELDAVNREFICLQKSLNDFI